MPKGGNKDLHFYKSRLREILSGKSEKPFTQTLPSPEVITVSD
jgi:hypothetical protein